MREGDERIFRRHRAAPADGWVLAVFSVPESERHRRHVLRSELTRLGFGMVAPGVWIVPAHPRDTTAQTLRRLGLDGYADLFRAEHLAFGDPAAKIRLWWDLDELERQYEAFIGTHEPARQEVPAGRPGGVRLLRAAAHRLAASPLPGPRTARPNCCRPAGSASGPPTCSSPCASGSRNRRGPTCRAVTSG